MARSTRQQGFTLIELMIVIAIIGILARTAIGFYGDFVIRAKMTEAVTMSATCRTTVAEQIIFGEMKETNKWGCEYNPLGAPDFDGANYVKSIQIDNHGIITVTLKGFNRPDIDNRIFTYAPIDRNGIVITSVNGMPSGELSHFECRTVDMPNYAVPIKYLPRTCVLI